MLPAKLPDLPAEAGSTVLLAASLFVWGNSRHMTDNATKLTSAHTVRYTPVTR